MKFTGERMIPEHNIKDKIYLEHVNRYVFASQFVKDKNVLDIACGSGYGSQILHDAGAKSVCGVDISQETIAYCQEKYPEITFAHGSVDAIPLEDYSVDVIVSFETLEHVDVCVQEKFMQEVNRVLRTDGILILSTPNALVYKEENDFHVKELTPKELDILLKKNHLQYTLFFQESIDSNYILSEEEIHNSSVQSLLTTFANNEKRKAWDDRFLIVVCSKKDHPTKVKGSVYVSNTQSIRHSADTSAYHDVIMQKEHEIQLMRDSKFWHARERYMIIKHWIVLVCLNPRKFLKSIFK
ncbi:MAG: hypothetical protein CR972_00110 [Candidatus Moraniibacteriota bacterium]|nr:MAG: hypothetical protein CR972_00110 [Candidatus Moranbacteria bacterium]